MGTIRRFIARPWWQNSGCSDPATKLVPAAIPGDAMVQPARLSSGHKLKFTRRWHCTGGILDANQTFPRGATTLLGRPHEGSGEMAISGMMKNVLVSVVDDDRSFRESMCRLMRS